MNPEFLTNAQNFLFLATHPILTLKTIHRRMHVGADELSPPPGTTIEEFPILPLSLAARLMLAAQPRESGGVPQNAWSPSDQARMARGEKPLGHPEHWNV